MFSSIAPPRESGGVDDGTAIVRRPLPSGLSRISTTAPVDDSESGELDNPGGFGDGVLDARFLRATALLRAACIRVAAWFRSCRVLITPGGVGGVLIIPGGVSEKTVDGVLDTLSPRAAALLRATVRTAFCICLAAV